jgi:hypothetical protein
MMRQGKQMLTEFRDEDGLGMKNKSLISRIVPASFQHDACASHSRQGNSPMDEPAADRNMVSWAFRKAVADFSARIHSYPLVHSAIAW